MSARNGKKNKKPLPTTLGKAPQPNNTEKPVDLGVVGKPVHTSLFGLHEILNMFQAGSGEVRAYARYECDILYECRVCRNIFRSFANFVLHKRNYCLDSYSPSDHHQSRAEENNYDIIYADLMETSRETTPQPANSKTESQSNLKKSLSSALKRLSSKQENEAITHFALTEDISNESKSYDALEERNTIAIEAIPSSGAGVFQTLFKNASNDSNVPEFMKTEVMELHGLLDSDEAVLSPSGSIDTLKTEKINERPHIPQYWLPCPVCTQRFSTRKTLAYHIKYKHNETRIVYPCPDCKDSFANAWCVFRHLYKVHRKTANQIKRLRDQVHNSGMKREDEPIKKKSKERCLLGLNENNIIQENQQWIDDFEGSNDLQMCGGCGKRFERKAALHSHSQMCMKRIAVCNNLKETAKKALQEEKEAKSEKDTKNEKESKGEKEIRTEKEIKSEKQTKSISPVAEIETRAKGSSRRKPKCTRRAVLEDEASNPSDTIETIEVREEEAKKLDTENRELTDIESKRVDNDDEHSTGTSSSERSKNKAERPSSRNERPSSRNERPSSRNERLPSKNEHLTSKNDLLRSKNESPSSKNDHTQKKLESKAQSINKDQDNNNERPEKSSEDFESSSMPLIQSVVVEYGSPENEKNDIDFDPLNSKDVDISSIAIDEIIGIKRPGDSTEATEDLLDATGGSSRAKESCSKSKESWSKSKNSVSKKKCSVEKVDSKEKENASKNDENRSEKISTKEKDNPSKEKYPSDINDPLKENDNLSKESESSSSGRGCSNPKQDCSKPKDGIEESTINIDDPKRTEMEDASVILKVTKQRVEEKPADTKNDTVETSDEEVDNIHNSSDSNDCILIEDSFEDPIDIDISPRLSENLRKASVDLECNDLNDSNDCILIEENANEENAFNVVYAVQKPSTPTDPIEHRINKSVPSSPCLIKGLGSTLAEAEMCTVEDPGINIFCINEQDSPRANETEDLTKDTFNSSDTQIEQFSVKPDQLYFDESEQAADFFDSYNKVDEKTDPLDISAEQQIFEDVPEPYKFPSGEETSPIFREDPFCRDADIVNTEEENCAKAPEEDSVTLYDQNSTTHLKKISVKLMETKQTGSKKRKYQDTVDKQVKVTKQIKCAVESECDTPELTLEMKSAKYVDLGKLLCVPCKLKFALHEQLMKHMSFHFRWFAFQCSKCLFMSYDKNTCMIHARKQHHPPSVENIVLPIPNWKTVNISSDFRVLKHTVYDPSGVVFYPEEEPTPATTTNKNDVTEPSTSSGPQLDIISPMKKEKVRKMIMEVIFGSKEKEANSPVKEKSFADSRPIRNRNKPLNTDFVYDMAQILRPKYKEDTLKSQAKVVKKTPLNLDSKKLSVKAVDYAKTMSRPSHALKTYEKKKVSADKKCMSRRPVFPAVKDDSVLESSARLPSATK